MTAPIIIAGLVRVPAAARAPLQPALEAFLAATRAEPGCRAFWFAYDAEDGETLRVFEIFDDEAAFAAHRTSAHMAAWRDARDALGVYGRDLTRYEIAAYDKI